MNIYNFHLIIMTHTDDDKCDDLKQISGRQVSNILSYCIYSRGMAVEVI